MALAFLVACGAARATSDPTPTQVPAAAPAMADPEPAPVAIGSAQTTPTWWCVSYRAGDLGTCYRERTACQEKHDRFGNEGIDVEACVPQAVAICFSSNLTQFPGKEDSVESCHPNTQACTSQREFALQMSGTTVQTVCRPLK